MEELFIGLERYLIYEVSTLILEAVASYDSCIRHALFGCLRTLKDLNILDHSTVFQELYEGWDKKCSTIVSLCWILLI